MTARERAYGSLVGLACGDALGMPTQSMSRAAVRRAYGSVDGLVDAVAEQPIAPGLRAGTITDDTEQALLLADELVEGRGRVDHGRFARRLSDWEDAMIARGSLDLLGPSTRAAVAAIKQGADPATTGTAGTTNGAAMRVAPVGIACPPEPLDRLLDRVEDSALPTHHTSLGLAGASAVAAAVSVGIDGGDVAAALDAAVAAARAAVRRGTWIAGADIAARLTWATGLLAARDGEALVVAVTDLIGTSVQSQESVVAALALAARFADDPVRALLVAVNAGGDTDTVAAMAGAVLGACGATWPAELADPVLSVNRLDLDGRVDALLALRAAAPTDRSPRG